METSMNQASHAFSHAHIFPIRKDGQVIAHQLRVDGGGPGNTRYFSSSKFGGPDKSLRAAQKAIRELSLPATKPRGGSDVGRLLKTSRTRQPGIRFVWTRAVSGPILRVVATWTDKNGVCRHTSYSVETNGLEGALDRAIAARTSNGAPTPDKQSLMRLLRKQYRARTDQQSDS
jgi:hypothetical protein